METYKITEEMFQDGVDIVQDRVNHMLEGSIFSCKVSYEEYLDAFRFRTAIIFRKDDMLSSDLLYRSYDKQEVIKHTVLKAIQSINRAMEQHLFGKDK